MPEGVIRNRDLLTRGFASRFILRAQNTFWDASLSGPRSTSKQRVVRSENRQFPCGRFYRGGFENNGLQTLRWRTSISISCSVALGDPDEHAHPVVNAPIPFRNTLSNNSRGFNLDDLRCLFPIPGSSVFCRGSYLYSDSHRSRRNRSNVWCTSSSGSIRSAASNS